jgi:hypothetical protein
VQLVGEPVGKSLPHLRRAWYARLVSLLIEARLYPWKRRAGAKEAQHVGTQHVRLTYQLVEEADKDPVRRDVLAPSGEDPGRIRPRCHSFVPQKAHHFGPIFWDGALATPLRHAGIRPDTGDRVADKQDAPQMRKARGNQADRVC